MGAICAFQPTVVSKATYTHSYDNWYGWMCDTLAAGLVNGTSAKRQARSMKLINDIAMFLDIADQTAIAKQSAAESFCAYYNNKDEIMSTRFTPLDGGVAEINAQLWTDWLGHP